MTITYICPKCGLKKTDYVPGLPKRIQIKKFMCAECLVVMTWVIKKNGETAWNTEKQFVSNAA